MDSFFTNKIRRPVNIFVRGGGVLTFAAPNITFTSDFTINIGGVSAVYTVVAGTVALNDGEVLYVTLPKPSEYATGNLTASHAPFAAFQQAFEKVTSGTLVPILYASGSNIYPMYESVYAIAGIPDYTIVNISSDTSLTLNAVNVVDTSVARSLTLPVGSSGKFAIMQDGTRQGGIVTLTRSGSDTIMGDTSLVINSIEWAIELVFSGTDWRIK